jgi:hypothetical protein
VGFFLLLVDGGFERVLDEGGCRTGFFPGNGAALYFGQTSGRGANPNRPEVSGGAGGGSGQSKADDADGNQSACEAIVTFLGAGAGAGVGALLGLGGASGAILAGSIAGAYLGWETGRALGENVFGESQVAPYVFGVGGAILGGVLGSASGASGALTFGAAAGAAAGTVAGSRAAATICGGGDA